MQILHLHHELSTIYRPSGRPVPGRAPDARVPWSSPSYGCAKPRFRCARTNLRKTRKSTSRPTGADRPAGPAQTRLLTRHAPAPPVKELPSFRHPGPASRPDTTHPSPTPESILTEGLSKINPVNKETVAAEGRTRRRVPARAGRRDPVISPEFSLAERPGPCRTRVHGRHPPGAVHPGGPAR